jgi:hypothetical protein
MSGDVFSVYTQFYIHTDNLCYYVQSAAWQETAEKTISELTGSSQKAAERITTLLGKQDQSLVNEAQILHHEQSILKTILRSKEELGETTSLVHRSIARLGGELDSQSKKLEDANVALERVVGGQTRMLAALRDSSAGSWLFYTGAFLVVVVLSQLLHYVANLGTTLLVNTTTAESRMTQYAELKYELRRRIFLLLLVSFALEEAICYLLPALPQLILSALSASFCVLDILLQAVSFACTQLGYGEWMQGASSVDLSWVVTPKAMGAGSAEQAHLVQVAMRHWAASLRYRILPLLLAACVVQIVYEAWCARHASRDSGWASASPNLRIRDVALASEDHRSLASEDHRWNKAPRGEASTDPGEAAITKTAPLAIEQAATNGTSVHAVNRRVAGDTARTESKHTAEAVLLESMQVQLSRYSEELRCLREWKQTQWKLALTPHKGGGEEQESGLPSPTTSRVAASTASTTTTAAAGATAIKPSGRTTNGQRKRRREPAPKKANSANGATKNKRVRRQPRSSNR